MADDDKAFVVCYRQARLPVPFVFSRDAACSQCGTQVWMSEETDKIRKSKDADVICDRCCASLVKDDSVVVEPPSAGQMGELSDALAARRGEGKN